MPDLSTDWIKPAIRDLLLEENPGQDVTVDVENVGYGTWLWEETSGSHVHMPSRELKASLGVRDCARLRKRLVRARTTWDDLRARRPS